MLDWTNYFIGTGILLTTIIVLWLQLRRQSKTTSGNFILELLKPWKEKEFKKFLDEINDPNITQYNEKKVEEFLNQLENISIFWKDGTISENHVKEFFGANLKAVRDDAFIQKYMNAWIAKKPDYYFVNLSELIKKVKDWKI